MISYSPPPPLWNHLEVTVAANDVPRLDYHHQNLFMMSIAFTYLWYATPTTDKF